MPSFISLASEYVPKARRAAVVSLLWAGFPLGGVVGGLLGSWIIPVYGGNLFSCRRRAADPVIDDPRDCAFLNR